MSTINKINYEQFAMDYLEGKLEGKLHQEMKDFLEKNPDIQEEMEEIQLFYLEPDETAVFTGKEALLRTPTSKKGMISPRFFGILSIILLSIIGAAWFLLDSSKENTSTLELGIPHQNDENIEAAIIPSENQSNINIEKVIESVHTNKEETTPIQKNEKQSTPVNNDIQPEKNTEESKIYDQPIANTTSPVKRYTPEIIEPNMPYETRTQEKQEPKNESPIATINPEKPQEEKPILEEVPSSFEIAAIETTEIETLAANYNHSIPENDIVIAEAPIVEIEEPSRLQKMGLIPENRRKRKINFKTLKDALVPEVFASKD